MSEGGDNLSQEQIVHPTNTSIVSTGSRGARKATRELSEPLLDSAEEGEMTGTHQASCEDTKARRIECVAESEGSPLMRTVCDSSSQDQTVAQQQQGRRRGDRSSLRLSSRFSFTSRPHAVQIDIPVPESPHYGTVLNYANIVSQVSLSIEKGGKPPELVVAGSSGSYWLYSETGDTTTKVGIFKPKSEEPYGPANPKWAKWFHRVLCPCCFGRSCLLPNTGYVSEAAAFAMDVLLDLRVVPPTSIIRLSAKTFNYNALEKRLPRLPSKVGSFQCLVECNGDGRSLQYDTLRQDQKEILIEQFQRLVVLDYMTRNTDRGLDNWLTNITDTEVRIHAIDNGLAFPFKHPDNWRIYPPSWASHPLGKKPFTKTIRKHVLRKIKASSWMVKAEARLREIMSIDEIFAESRFQGQIAVIRGQRQNLVSCLERENSTPEELFAMHPLYIIRKSTGMVGWRTHLPCFTCC